MKDIGIRTGFQLAIEDLALRMSDPQQGKMCNLPATGREWVSIN
jgi:hypothetical protein